MAKDPTVFELEARVRQLELINPNSNGEIIGYETISVEYTEPGEYTYYANFIVSFGQRVARPGAGVFVNRLWANGELIYDKQNGFAKPAKLKPVPPVANSGGVKRFDSLGNLFVGTPPKITTANPLFTFFDGNEEQGEVLRGMHYRGLMVARFLHFDVTDYGNNIPAITAELIDSDFASTTANIRAFSGYGESGYFVELHPNHDTLFRAYHRFSGSLTQVDFASAKTRLSTRTPMPHVASMDQLSLAVGLGDTSFEDFAATYLPEQNFMLVQPGIDQLDKRLYTFEDGIYGRKVNSALGLSGWHAVISFKVINNGLTDTVVLGATHVVDGADYPYSTGVLVDRKFVSGELGGLDEPTRAIVRGDVRNGETDIYLITETEVVRVVVGPGGAILSQTSIYTATGEFIQGWFDAVNLRLMVAEESDGVAHTGVIRGIERDGALVFTSEATTVPKLKHIRYATSDATSDLSGGSLIYNDYEANNKVNYLDLNTGEVRNLTIGLGFAVPTTAMVWDSRTGVLWGSRNVYVTFGDLPDTTLDDSRLDAGDVMRAYALHVGYSDDNVTTVNMDDLYLDGYVVSADNTSLANLATAIGGLYGFNWTERAGDIVFKANYLAEELVIDTTAPFEKLAFLGGNGGDYFTVARNGDTSIPVKLSLSFFDPDNQYEVGRVDVARNMAPLETTEAVAPVDWSLPLTIAGDYARELLNAALYRMWAQGKVGYQLRLPPEFITVDAGDTLEFSANGYTYQAVIRKHRVNGDYSVSLDLVEAATASYPVKVAAQAGTSVSSGATPVRSVVLDMPALAEAENVANQLNLLVLLAGYEPDTFKSGTFELSVKGDTTDIVGRVTADSGLEAYIGTLTENLAAPAFPFELDTVNSVYIEAGTITDERVEAGVSADETTPGERLNLVAIGEWGGVELVQYLNFEVLTDGSYRLFNLLRGRFGTEVFAGAFAGAPVSFLDNAQIIQYPYIDYLENRQWQYRTYAPGQPTWQIDNFYTMPSGNSRKPYAPIEITVERDTVNSDIVFKFTRRARFYNSPPTDFMAPVPLDELTEAYEVNIYDGNGEVIRTITNTDLPQAVYTSAEQIEDEFTGDETSITATVHQSSVETIGAGLTMPDTYTVYAAGTQFVRSRFALGGTYDVSPAPITPPGELAFEFGLGGVMALNVGSNDMGAVFDLGGGMATDIAEYIPTPPVTLSGAMGLGGAVRGAIDAPIVYEYENAEEYSHDWANLTGYNSAGVQINSNRLYGVSGANPSAAIRPYDVVAGAKVQFVAKLRKVSGNNNINMIGLQFGGTTPATNSPNFIGIGSGSGSYPTYYAGTNFTGISTGQQTLVASVLAAEDWFITVALDDETISLSMRSATKEYAISFPRSAAPNGGVVTGIMAYNGDSRGLSGSYIGPIGAKRSLTPFRVKSLGGVEFESTTMPKSIYKREGSEIYWCQYPPNYDVGEDNPVAIHFHQATTGEERSLIGESRSTAMAIALGNAGYVLLAARDLPDRWGNQTQLDNAEFLVQWANDNLGRLGEVFLIGTSMGGVPSYNTIIKGGELASRVKAMVGICAVADLQEMYDYTTTFRTALRAAYGAADATEFAANAAPYDPIAADLSPVAGVGFKHWVAASADTTVPPASHTTPMVPLLTAAGGIVETTVVSGAGHLPTGCYDASGVVAFFDGYRSGIVTPVIRSYTEMTDTDGGSIPVAKPAGLQVGDLMLASISSSGYFLTLPSGWDYANTAAAPNTDKGFFAWKIADSTDAAASTFTFSQPPGTEEFSVILLAIKNVDTVSPFIGEFSRTPATGSANLESPALASGSAGNLLVSLVAGAGAAPTLSPPVGTVELAEAQTALTTVAVGSRALLATGAVAATVWTGSGAAMAHRNGWTVAVKGN